MATTDLMASRPGAYTREGLIVDNPEVVANGVAPSGSYPITADLVVPVAQRYRLLSIVTDVAIDVLQVKANETTLTATGAPTRVRSTGSNVSYACLLHPATAGVYVKTA